LVLLGGATVHRSARFATRQAAESWLRAAQEINAQTGREATDRVVGSNKPPQIEE
jgi:hypothetical protein